MKFRKKPVVIDAVQFDPHREPWPDGVYGHKPTPGSYKGVWAIDTLEGTLNVSSGDWIITGIKGERYPCKPNIFAATYELVED